MSDDIKSHRYYFIDNSLNIYRVKWVDNLIEFLDYNYVNVVRMTNEETYRLYSN